MEQTPQTTIQISRVTSAVMDEYAAQYREETGARMPKFSIGDRAILKDLLRRLTPERRAKLLAQYPQLKKI